ncbi:MAG: efflux RND transporter permease subunit, partial [Pseudomonadota bacterium]|nr:efflux RND transporter permease subunit [Pseudomonadota bacterium]
ALKRYAKMVRDHLLSKGVDRVDLYGARSEEIWVSLEPEVLRKLDMTVADISNRIRGVSQDLPAGEIAGGQRQVRSMGLKKEATALQEIDVKSFADGRKITLKDIASVSEEFHTAESRAFRMGNIAVEFDIQRATNTDALQIAKIVNREVEEIKKFLPTNITLEEYDVRANSIKERIDLLVTNGLGGLALVLIILFLFMNPRVGIWVALGIPASLLATLAIMWASGQTINMISLFGMIMAIGIVVDDAIVVGEHADYRFNQGLSAGDAAIAGAERMIVPVMSSTLTTIAAFIPLFVISGVIGQIISAIPFVVITVLIASLIECFLVLPAHLTYGLASKEEAGFFKTYRKKLDINFSRFKKEKFCPLVQKAINYRYVTLSIALSFFMISVGSVMGGHVGYQFFPSPEPNTIFSNIRMLPGTTREETRSAVLEVEKGLFAALEGIKQKPEELIVMSLGRVGTIVGNKGASSSGQNDIVGGVIVELVSSELRDLKSSEVIAAWRKSVSWPAGVENLTFEGQRSGPPGRDMDIRLRSNGDIQSLKYAAKEVMTLLERYPGVSDVDDDMPYGKPEVLLEVNSRGQSLGFTTETVARQVRDFIDGSIAKRFSRGDEEVLVRVLLDRSVVDNDVLQSIFLRSSGGQEVPLTEVVDFRASKGFARIKREDGVKEVAISAEVDKSITRPSYIQSALFKDGLREIARNYGIDVSFAGRAREQRETTSDMLLGAILGLSLIYIILAWVFSSYTRPLVIMSIVPLGFVGAVLGHGLLGYDLTILSIFAILGLSGILINDSIVLVTTINERAKSELLSDALVLASGDRLRAVFLTSATTIGGLTPLLFEGSLQAQFLIPMAITLVFGLAVATLIVLFIVPSLVLIEYDLLQIFRKRKKFF